MVKGLIDIIVQYCNTDFPQRQDEYDFCIKNNLNNPYVATVHNLVEPKTRVPEDIKNHPKYREISINRWLTFEDAVLYANDQLRNRIVAICNLDIYLDQAITEWQELQKLFSDTKFVLCLTRFETDGKNNFWRDETLKQYHFANSHDTWIFKSPIYVKDIEFELGMLGCDNALAHRLKKAGYLPLNLSNRYRIYHLDIARGKYHEANVFNLYDQSTKSFKRLESRYPEQKGYFLLPDFDHIKDVPLDTLLKSIKLTDLQEYYLKCELLNTFWEVNNRQSKI